MPADPLKTWRKPILIVYKISFFLPVRTGFSPGVMVFLMTIGLAIASLTPVLIIIALANPLFWWGQLESRQEHWGRAAILNSLAAVASIPSILFVANYYEDPLRDILLETGSGWRLIWVSGHFAWVSSLVLMAFVNLVAFGASSTGRPIRISLKWIMLVVAITALALKGWGWLAANLFWNFSAGSEFPVPPGLSTWLRIHGFLGGV